jgi:uncharacterized protein YecE (DUF72 family)
VPVIRLGTQGWAYPDWVATFYPPGAKQQDYLPFYSEVFDTVELDTTFYHPPRPSVVRGWARHTPESFRFAAKVPQRITHEARLAAMGEHFDAFVRALEPLGARRGPLLVQLPAEFQHDAGTMGVLGRFLAAAPKETRLAVELRHGSWRREDVYELLRKHGATLAWTEWRELPHAAEITADFLYVRWLGHREPITSYDRIQIDRSSELDAWQHDLERVLPQVREVYGYFNNHWAGHSPASANDMKRRLGLKPVDPKSRWPQGELW